MPYDYASLKAKIISLNLCYNLYHSYQALDNCHQVTRLFIDKMHIIVVVVYCQ